MCREPVGPRAKGAKGLIQWPSYKDLEGLSGAIRDLASIYSRGDGSTWCSARIPGYPEQAPFTQFAKAHRGPG